MTESKEKFKQAFRTLQGDNMTLREHNGLLTSKIKVIEDKIAATHKFMISSFSFLGDIETRLECVKKVLIDNDLTTADDYEAIWDEVKGIRIKRDDEFIEPGDFCRVTFQGVDKETDLVILEENNFPVRLGAKVLFVDDYLLGKSVGQKVFEFDHAYGDDYHSDLGLAGKTLAFKLSIDKVKTRINKGSIDA